MKCDLYKNNAIAITGCFNERDIIKNDFNGVWSDKEKVWLVSLNSDNLARLRTRFGACFTDELQGFFDKRQVIEKTISDYDSGLIKPDTTFNKYFKNCELMEHQLIGATIANTLFDANFTGCLLSME